MIARIRCLWVGVILSATVWFGPVFAQQAGEGQTIAGFEVPEYDEENRLKYIMFGDFAKVLPNGLIDITNMRIDFFTPEGDLEMRVNAEKCLYDNRTKNARSENLVRIARDNLIISGRGFVWDAGSGRFEILEDSKVVLREAQRVVNEEEEP